MSNDIIAIEQLLAAYCHHVDRGSAREVAALFCEDATLKPNYDGPYELHGRAEVERWYAFYHETFRAGVRHLKHMIMSPLIEVDGDHASGVSYLLASAVSEADGRGFYVTGTYRDTFRRVGGRWRFAVRQIDVDAMTTHNDVVETFPPLNFPHT